MHELQKKAMMTIQNSFFSQERRSANCW